MSSPVSDLRSFLRNMEPVLNPGILAFVSVSDQETLKSVPVIATIREPEGISAVIAGARHDHIFVSMDSAALAMSVLKRMQKEISR